jgi:hypothetical protein
VIRRTVRGGKPSPFKQTIKMPARGADPIDCPEPGVPCYPFGFWSTTGVPVMEVSAEADLSIGFCFACTGGGGSFPTLAATYTWTFDVDVVEGTIDAPTVVGDPGNCFDLVFGSEVDTGLIYLTATALFEGDEILGPILLVVRVVD